MAAILLNKLQPGKTYTVAVKALDSDGNISENSLTYTFTTPRANLDGSQLVATNTTVVTAIANDSASVVGGALTAGSLDANGLTYAGKTNLATVWNSTSGGYTTNASLTSTTASAGAVIINSTGILGYQFGSATNVGQANFFLNTLDGNAYFRGTIFAAAGKIGGFNIGASSLVITASTYSGAPNYNTRAGTFGIYADPNNYAGKKIVFSGQDTYLYGAQPDSGPFLAEFGLDNDGSITGTYLSPYIYFADYKSGYSGTYLKIWTDEVSRTAGIGAAYSAGPTIEMVASNPGYSGSVKLDPLEFFMNRNSSSGANLTPGIYMTPLTGYVQILRDTFAEGSQARPALFLQSNYTSTADWRGLQFQRQLSAGAASLTSVGYVAVANSTTTAPVFTSGSDYRLKTNIVDAPDNFSKIIKSIRAVRFDEIAVPENKNLLGFIAHEIQKIIPESVDGKKDEVDLEGKPVYQHLAQAKFIPYLMGALKESILKIEELEQRLASLENK